MMTGSICNCLVCQMEKSLIAELSDEALCKESRSLAASSSILSLFASPVDLVRQLHAPEDGNVTLSADALLSELLKQHERDPLRPICQRLLLLAFIPTIHRTTSSIAAIFLSLARDDISQHVVSVFLEFLHSPELRARRSHLAFTIARKLRRQAFRWAVRETRGSALEELEGDPIAEVEQVIAEEPLYANILLQQFLDTCQKMGWLSGEERNLLIRFKIEGATCHEIAGRNGHAAMAVRHRVHRLLERLRRLAQRTRWERAAEQLELFAR
jgi:DNA-directed RNA polymerase specialized sigma24 family protein